MGRVTEVKKENSWLTTKKNRHYDQIPYHVFSMVRACSVHFIHFCSKIYKNLTFWHHGHLIPGPFYCTPRPRDPFPGNVSGIRSMDSLGGYPHMDRTGLKGPGQGGRQNNKTLHPSSACPVILFSYGQQPVSYQSTVF